MLARFGVPHESRVVSAHRTPDWMREYATAAEARGLEVIIAGAGGAAHLPGMVAAHTMLPVLGVPVESRRAAGLDSLLSIVQMPGGVPVGTLAIGKAGATNAALLAVSILALERPELREKLQQFRERADRARAGRNAAVSGMHPARHHDRRPGQRPTGADVRHRRAANGLPRHTFSPDDDTPTGQVADVEVDAALRRSGRGARVRRGVDVVTFEFENIPAATAEAAAAVCPVRPSGQVLHTTQHRLREKTFLRSRGFPVTPFAPVQLAANCTQRWPSWAAGRAQNGRLGLRRQGPGQDHDAGDEAAGPGDALGQRSRARSVRRFEHEVSVVAARGFDGSLADYGVIANAHANHILDVSSRRPASRRRRRARRSRSRRRCWKSSTWSACCASSSS